VKRRKLLKQLGFGLSGGLLLPHLLSSCTKDDPGPEVPFDGDVVVIGAGAAGMYAADILNAKGIKVTILEAGDQIGGRVRSERNQTDEEVADISVADFPVELGAEIIYGSDSIWGTNLKNYFVNAISIDEGFSDRYILDAISKTEEDWNVDGDFENAQNFVESLANFSQSGVTVKQAATGLPARVEALINSQIGNLYGSTNDTVGMAALSETLKARTHDGVRQVLKSNPMQDFLIFRFDQVKDLVRLNTKVTSVDSSGSKVIVTVDDGTQIETDKVIVTVPISILKKNTISFSPGLPSEMISSMAKIGMDHSIRVVIDFKKNFWGESSRFTWGGTLFPNCFNAGIGRGEFNRTLSITINGPKAKMLSDQGEGMIDSILAELDEVYDGQASQFVRRSLDDEEKILWIRKDWGKDEFIQGGYSYPMASATLEDRENLGLAIGDKVFFAGEATDVSGDAGTINGALASAERVTQEIIKSITGE
jgi:monoamine oxidase